MILRNFITNRTAGMNGPITGSDLVGMSLDEAGRDAAGELERLRAKIDRLGSILGGVLEQMPPEKALELAQLYSWELVKE